MDIPDGWQLVLIAPNSKMLQAAYEALRWYLDGLPEEEKCRRFGNEAKYGTCVFTNKEKFTARWEAMLKAAPTYEEKP